MNNEIKTLWVNALRSGEHKQGKQALHTTEGLCCLGVLCHIAEKEGVCEAGGGERTYISYDENFYHLPQSVIDWAGLSNVSPVVARDNEYVQLSDLNDRGSTFLEIADLIEQDPVL